MDPYFLVLGAVFLLALSFFGVGIYFSTRSRQKDAPGKAKPASQPLEEDSTNEGMHEVARLLRDDRSGKLVLEKDGIFYRTADDLDAEQRRSLMVAAGDLHALLGLGREAQPEAGRVQSAPTMTRGTPTGPLSSRLQARSQEFPDAQIKPPSMNPVDVFARAIASDVPKIDLTSKSITAQIDDILQERLVNTHLEQRGIRLLDAPDGRVVVFIGIESYDGVDAVPDEEVRRAIRGAVAEWERRSTPSM